jgi:hypothetical protein
LHLEAVLSLAQVYEATIEGDPNFPVTADELIRLRLH